MKRKILAISLAAIMLLLSACSSGGEDKEASTPDTSGTTEGTQQPDEQSSGQDGKATVDMKGGTLKVLVLDEITDQDKERTAEFEKLANCKVEYTVTDWANMNNKVVTSINAGSPFDVAWIYGVWFPADAIANMMEPLDNYISQDDLYDPNNVNAGGLDLEKMKYFTWGGHYYALSGYKDIDIGVMFYNKKLIRDYGVDDPMDLYKEGKWNWDSFYNIAMEFTDIENGKCGFSKSDSKPIVFSNDVQYVKIVDGEVKENLHDPKLLEAWQFWQKINFGNTAISIDDGIDRFITGVSVFGASTAGLGYAKQIMEKGTDDVKNNWGIVPYPLGPSNTTGSYPGAWMSGNYVVKGSKNVEAAVAYILHKTKYQAPMTEYYTEEQQALIDTLYQKVNYSNHAYGFGDNSIDLKLYGTEYDITHGADLPALIEQYAPMFQGFIDATIAQQ